MGFAQSKILKLVGSGVKFRHPISKKRTETIVKTLRSAEAALDKFWAVTDAHFQDTIGVTPYETISEILEERTIQRTPPWVSQNSPSTTSSSVDYLYVPLSSHLHNTAKEITGSFDRLEVLVTQKTKTHDVDTLASDDDKVGLSVQHVKVSQARIYYLDKRSHKVYRNLLHSPSSRDHPGDIP